jgi:hypothetical protein
MSRSALSPNTPDKHLEIAQQFESQFLEMLATPERADHWTIVVMFYSACHYLRSFVVARTNRGVTSHEDIRDFFRRDKVLGLAEQKYNALQQYSQNARYYGHPYTHEQKVRAHKELFDAVKAATTRRR